jgi:hypothetical protein
MLPLTVHSSAFASDEPIPRMHTGDGEDLSPPLSWAGAPPETREFAVICEDPDAPTPEPWVHWLLDKLPPGTTSLPAGIPPAARLGAPPGCSWPRRLRAFDGAAGGLDSREDPYS